MNRELGIPINESGDHDGAIQIHFPWWHQNQQGGVSLWYDMQPFVVVWRHFHVAGRNFEEILQRLKINKQTSKQTKRAQKDF